MAKSLAVAAMLLPMGGATFMRQAPSDPCTCVNWKQAYATKGALCGGGHEMFHETRKGRPIWMARMKMGLEFCEFFYKRINENFCLNLDHVNEPDAWYGGQWCYVSEQCKSAAPSNRTGSLRVKLCTEGKDNMLRDKSPEEVIEWARKNDFETGTVLKFAYPVERKAMWPLVKDAFMAPTDLTVIPNPLELMNNPVGKAALRESTETAHSRLGEIIASNKPVVLDSHEGTPPFAVIRGDMVHLVTYDHSPDFHHLGSLTEIKCVAGCK